MQFSESKVEYASHQLSLYYGECPHRCSYCFVTLYRKRGWAWAKGPLRLNPKAMELAKKANGSKVDCLVVSFTCDPLPYSPDMQVHKQRLDFLIEIMEVLEEREIPTKILTKNGVLGILPELDVPPYQHIQLGMSLTGNVDTWQNAAKYEGLRVSNAHRFDRLKHLSEYGFRTWASLEPILPETNIERLLKRVCWGNKIEEIWVGKPNYHKKLIDAYNWAEVAQLVAEKMRRSPQLKMKKELREYLRWNQ